MRNNKKTVRNIIEMATEKAFHDVIEQAIREALILEQRANEARAEAEKLDELHAACAYTKAFGMKEGVGALCQVLQRIFGGPPAHIIQAIQKIAFENATNKYLGRESKDYVSILLTYLEVSA
jgi:hypothetical protein